MATRTAAAKAAPVKKTAARKTPAKAASRSPGIGEPVDIDEDTPTRGGNDIVMARGAPGDSAKRG